MSTLTDLLRAGFPRRAAALVAAKLDATGSGGGGGGGVSGASRADAWGWTGINGQARPADGFDITTLAGASAGITTKLTAFGSGQAASLLVAAAGWYEAKLYIDLQFGASAPEVVNAGIDYPNEGYYYPTWQFPVPAISKRVKTFAGTTGPIYVPAGGELTISAQWSGAIALSGAQFAVDVVKA